MRSGCVTRLASITWRWAYDIGRPTTYRPAWYPNQDPDHNPWVVPDTMTGKTHYETWADSLKPGELLALIDEHAPDDR